ncbi:MAG: TldD/PmbA family protein [bacterium]
MEKIMEMATRRAEEAELYRVRSQTKEVGFQANKLKSVESAFEDGVGLRVIKNQRIGFSSLTNLRDPQPLISSALESAKFGQKACFNLPRPDKIPSPQCYDSRIIPLKTNQMVEVGERTVELILKEAPNFKCDGAVEKTEIEVAIMNSRGLSFSFKKTNYVFSFYAFLAKEGDFLGVQEGEASCRHQDWSSSVARRITEAIRLSRKIFKINPGRYPAIFTPKAVPLLLQSLKVGINGKIVQKKASPLLGKLGTRIVSPCINITDDPLVSFGLATAPLDGEGIPSRRTEIIQEGVLKSFIYDLQTAGLMGTESTANGARGYDSLPSPSPSNFILNPGDTSFEEMVKDVKEGIIVDQVIGSGQGNILMGEFSVNLDLGYKVEKGKIVGRLKDIMVSGNAYTMFNQVVALGRDVRWVGSTRTPSIYFKEINVAG